MTFIVNVLAVIGGLALLALVVLIVAGADIVRRESGE